MSVVPFAPSGTRVPCMYIAQTPYRLFGCPPGIRHPKPVRAVIYSALFFFVTLRPRYVAHMCEVRFHCERSWSCDPPSIYGTVGNGGSVLASLFSDPGLFRTYDKCRHTHCGVFAPPFRDPDT